MEEKINYEYEIFVLDCLRQSKPGIYARSEEIETKKQIFQILKSKLKDDTNMKKKIMSLDNILETAYRYVSDYKNPKLSNELLIEAWLNTL